MSKKAIIVGSGVGGLSSGIRLAKLGFEVLIFESNGFIGGKVNSKMIGEYRFDMGPSVFTEPHLIEELVSLCGKSEDFFQYHKLEESCRYFFSDGQHVTIKSGKQEVSKSFQEHFGEDLSQTKAFLGRIKSNYEAVYPVFIEVSLHRFTHWFNKSVWKAISRIPKYGLMSSMHQVNKSNFKNPKTTQILNRMATYNGSSPYKTPGMLNIISHLELNEGPAMPKGGMVAITNTLKKLAEDCGIKFYTNEFVSAIIHQNNEVVGVKTKKGSYACNLVVSNMDVHFTYEKLLNGFAAPKKILNQEKSTSAIVFYWGIKGSFDQLGVHNILFADDYESEFKALFETKSMHVDPTIYIHITSKIEKNDAPNGCENWFVMVNAPINIGQDWDQILSQMRERVLTKISKQLNTTIEELIEVEEISDPRKIESTYFGKQGSIYGNSSNGAFSAFYRHPNFSKKIKGLYFSGVTVHPGGGIPLALNSAKIVERCVKEDFLLS
ncbi:MAG: phytoene desaturase [Bacteroidetes bacterium]|nr:phytoene desaturase [Bacteroidota bacterium]